MKREQIPVAYWLIGANVVLFAVLQLGPTYLYRALGQTSLLVRQYGLYWQVFTALFIHFDIFHLALNMFALYYFGLINEGIYRAKRFVAIYFLSGLVGNVASLFVLAPLTVTGGASGAVFGIIGSYAVYQRKAEQLLGALIYASLIFVQSMGFHVNIIAHLFGLLAGLVLGLLLTPPQE